MKAHHRCLVAQVNTIAHVAKGHTRIGGAAVGHRTAGQITIHDDFIPVSPGEHHLTVDGLAGPQVWHALIADTLAGKRRDAGYSYVYVHRGLPQSLTLWHNGHEVLRSPGNTGVPAASSR